jgi:NhaP-type Na+/H+ or K+/H+ antiporter
MLAERLHLSGIITMVVFAMAASRRAPEIMPARIRIPSWAVWEVAVFVLNVLAFILVGFQLKSIAARATGATGHATRRWRRRCASRSSSRASRG